MRTATFSSRSLLSAIMPDLELSKTERLLARDPLWWRLFLGLAPSVRRDIVGWLGVHEPQVPNIDACDEDARARLREYLEGASLAFNPLPTSDAQFYTSDAAALASDSIAVRTDLRDVVYVISGLMDSVYRHNEQRYKRSPRPKQVGRERERRTA